jgi:hypothetical protein
MVQSLIGVRTTARLRERLNPNLEPDDPPGSEIACFGHPEDVAHEDRAGEQ